MCAMLVQFKGLVNFEHEFDDLQDFGELHSVIRRTVGPDKGYRLKTWPEETAVDVEDEEDWSEVVDDAQRLLFEKLTLQIIGTNKRKRCPSWDTNNNKKFAVDFFGDPFAAPDSEEKAQTFSLAKQDEYTKWREGRTDALLPGEELTSDDIVDPAWWYAQVCLACLNELQHTNIKQHLLGGNHRANVTKIRMRCTYKRKVPLLCGINGGGPIARNVNHWLGHPNTILVEQYLEGQFASVCDFRKDESCLTLGEQDFSFTLAVASHLGNKVIGTSYLGAYDPTVPEVNIKLLDDGARRFHTQKTLQSMNGDLQRNLDRAMELGVKTFHNVDAMDIEGSLLDRVEGGELLGPFNHCIFPFPRMTLKRGCDPGNSVLLQKFFRSASSERVLLPNGLVQLVMLKNQFREWDVVHLAEEAGFDLRAVADFNFVHIAYQPRDVTGNPINKTALNGKVLMITFRRTL